MRAKRIFYSSIARFVYEAVAVAAGLILPRLILSRFGSDYNGVAASISQFIGYISILTLGVTNVTCVALYKPLAEKDTQKISGIVRATEVLMRKIALLFVGIITLFTVLYPFLVIDTFDWFFTFSLCLILCIGTFATYFFGTAHGCVLNADQRGYITTLVHICTIIVNVFVAVTLILMGFEYRIVMLASSIVFLANPIFSYVYVRKRYKITREVAPDNTALKQRWDAFAHGIADFISNNTDMVLLTVFIGIREVSVYAVYFMILQHVGAVVHSLTGYGYPASLGDMISKNEHTSLKNAFGLYEFFSIKFSSLLYICAALLIVPFVTVYTVGIIDADYYRPLFAYIICASLFLKAIRTPYRSLIYAAGHFKQTRNGALAEVAIKIILSIVLVQFFGIIGVAIGGLCASLFRTAQLAIYTLRYIVKIPLKNTILRVFTSLASIGLIIGIVYFLPKMANITYVAWIIHALMVSGVSVIVISIVTFVFYRNEAYEVLSRVKVMVLDFKAKLQGKSD